MNQVRKEKAELEKQIEKEHHDNLELRAKLDAKLSSLSPSTGTSNNGNDHDNMRPNTAYSLDSSTPSLQSDENNNTTQPMQME